MLQCQLDGVILMNGISIPCIQGGGLSTIVQPISDIVSSLYWILENPQEIFRCAGDDIYLGDGNVEHSLPDLWGMLLAPRDLQNHSSFMIAPPGFLPKYSQYISGDWTCLAGIRSMDTLKDLITLNRSFVTDNCELCIVGVDACTWDLYARDAAVLDRLYKHFPDAQASSLDGSVLDME